MAAISASALTTATVVTTESYQKLSPLGDRELGTTDHAQDTDKGILEI